MNVSEVRTSYASRRERRNIGTPVFILYRKKSPLHWTEASAWTMTEKTKRKRKEAKGDNKAAQPTQVTFAGVYIPQLSSSKEHLECSLSHPLSPALHFCDAERHAYSYLYACLYGERDRWRCFEYYRYAIEDMWTHPPGVSRHACTQIYVSYIWLCIDR